LQKEKKMLSDDVMYKALVDKDISYEGLFVTGVKTTGIFCRTTCTARKPLKENVEFFATAKEAMLHGYRPCKVCSPLENIGSTPPQIQKLLAELNENPSLKLKDADVVSRGIEPSTLRRWFKKNHGITFQAYQRMQRINTAFTKIQEGETVTNAAFDTGYESLSGFSDSFTSLIGTAPSKSKDKEIIRMTRLETPLGPMFACATEEGICLLEFVDRRMLETELKTLSKQFNAIVLQGHSKYFEPLKKQLDEYFEGKRKEFDIPLVLKGTEFQKEVWKELMRIPYGSTRSYKQQSIALNNLKAIRAVASANGMNHIAIIIPCHRVIGEDSSMTGYGGGIWRKKRLLDIEGSQTSLGIF
jgi:AraC family transcriptional regulator of adaptative response/methylated-DNA-[protein]-cysteine methyltransferase